MKKKLIIFFTCIIILALFIYLSTLFLTLNFDNNGEAFSKGYGHLLEENLLKGIFYVSSLNLFTSSILTLIFLNFFTQKKVNIGYVILKIISAIIILTILTYLYFEKNNIENDYISNERIIEVLITWLFRVFGIFLGILLDKRILKLDLRHIS